MKTAVQWLEEYLKTKVLPCPEGNDYVYGMNVAHENLINYVIPALLEKEKSQLLDAYTEGTECACQKHIDIFENYYQKTYNL